MGSLLLKLARLTDPPQRRFAIGDIHGCSRTLHKMIEEVLLLRPADTLYILGDLIDRGHDSRGILDYLLQLRGDGYDIQAIRGNHEEMLLYAVDDLSAHKIWYGNGGWATLREFGVDSPEEIPQRYIEYITSLPYYIESGDYICVHAGLDFTTEDPLRDTSRQYMLWARDSDCQVDATKIDGRILVTAHTVMPLFDIRASLDTSHIRLDNGCYDKGELSCGALVALNLDTKELLVQENIERQT